MVGLVHNSEEIMTTFTTEDRITASDYEELRIMRDRALETSRKIVEFVRNNPPSYKQKVAEAPAHVGYES